MTTDYESFLHVAEDGRIWWLRQDAIRLGAGFLPVCDDNRQLAPRLQAPHQRARVNERTLIGALGDARSTIPKPMTFERDDFRYVDAAEFLEWLSQYICQKQAKIEFPNELVGQVQIALAKAAAVRPPQAPQIFESLTIALEGCFDKNFDELPESIRERIERAFLVSWETLSPGQRRTVAEGWDHQNDPTTEDERQHWFDFTQRRWALKKQIETWERTAAPTAGDLSVKENQLAKLRLELESMDREQREACGDNNRASKKCDKTDRRRLDHDPELQKRANEIASEKKNAGKRRVTKNKVALSLARKVGMDAATVLRRIRKQW